MSADLAEARSSIAHDVIGRAVKELEAQHQAAETRCNAATLRLKDLHAEEAATTERIAKLKAREADILAVINEIEAGLVEALDRLMQRLEVKR